MRILGFSEKWPKLNLHKPIDERDIFTTFRFPRKDRDWEVDELVQVVYKPRSKEREVLGIARIIRKYPKDIGNKFKYYGDNDINVITPSEAIQDGFIAMHGGGDLDKMRKYFINTYGYLRCMKEPISRLILYWCILEVNDA